MAGMTFKVEPINRDIALFLDDLSEKEASRQFASLAAVYIDDAKRTNARILGREPPSTTYVNGVAGAALDTVGLNGVIFTEFELLTEVLQFISKLLDQFSPVGQETDRRPGHPGLYRRSHILLADGVEIASDIPSLVPQTVALAEEYTFINTVPYARKIERGSSRQAPDGVYQAVANLARRKFTKLAKITFSYRTVLGGTGGAKSERNPAIIVRIV